MTVYDQGLEYPDADWPDFEKVAGTILRPLVAHDQDIGNFLIADYDTQIEDHDTPFITIHERDGQTSADDFTQFARIEVTYWGKSRQVARGTATQGTRLILQAAGTEVDGALIDTVEPATGSEESQLDNPDDRCVTRVFTFGFRPMYQS